MKNYITFLIFFILTNIVFSQQFKLTDEHGSYFSYDSFANEVYFARDPSIGTIKKIDLETKVVTEVNFTSLPVFMHNSHKAIYYKITDTSNIFYLYNFITDSTKQIYENKIGSRLLKFTYDWPWFSISPDDTRLLNFSAFVIEDSTWIYLSDNVAIPSSYIKQEWSSDTSFIFFSLNNALAEYDFTTGKVDTLVTKNERILNFAYNIKYGLLAYSTGDYNEQDYVFVYNKYSRTEKLVYGPDIDSIYCSMGTQEINDITWSPDGINLVYFSYDYTNPGTGIDIYNILGDKIIKVTECVGIGLKKNVIWTNNDTIIYAYGNSEDQIYGFDLNSILTSVSLISPQNYKLYLSNYPNPFNPSTIIKYAIPTVEMQNSLPTVRQVVSQHVQIKVYNILGREIATLVNKEQRAGIYEVVWNGKNNNQQKVSAGVYLVRLEVNNSKNILNRTMKIMYLK